MPSKLLQEYQENGTKLDGLINRYDKQVEIYRFGRNVEILQAAIKLLGEDVLPEFMESIWF